MNVETLVNDVKARTDVVVTRGQEVLEAGFETLKAANAIVVDGVQTLVQTNVAAGKELIELAQASFEKAKADGLKAVAANPAAYLPEGKATVLNAYNESVATVTKTGDQLAKTLKEGYQTISAKLSGTSAEKKAAAKATKKTAARKSTGKARKTTPAAAA
ncbi:Phasin protein [Fontimonas thermophila]|uniref:Phasin protein n=1 Tax=Fontimonas thermophila TaxID=1076937 RepID=A0A1I2J3C9_9GAMM|nr:phasin family protein [Fontimonas thermophila]SFF49014.1 Phasin protein [Fontimonas thermophila]